MLTTSTLLAETDPTRIMTPSSRSSSNTLKRRIAFSEKLSRDSRLTTTVSSVATKLLGSKKTEELFAGITNQASLNKAKELIGKYEAQQTKNKATKN